MRLLLSRIGTAIHSRVLVPLRRRFHRRYSSADGDASSVGWYRPERVVYGLIATNVGVWFLWRIAAADSTGRGVDVMMNNFTVSYRNISAGRVWTVVTSAFSQSDVAHLAVNVVALFVFGRELVYVIGVRRFIVVYIGGGIAASIAHVVYQNAIMASAHRSGADVDVPCLGASGSAMAITTLFAALFPTATFTLYFFIPVPAWLCVAGICAYDVSAAYQHYRRAKSDSETRRRGNSRLIQIEERSARTDTVAHGAHIGGALFGLIYYAILRRARVR